MKIFLANKNSNSKILSLFLSILVFIVFMCSNIFFGENAVAAGTSGSYVNYLNIKTASIYAASDGYYKAHIVLNSDEIETKDNGKEYTIKILSGDYSPISGANLLYNFTMETTETGDKVFITDILLENLVKTGEGDAITFILTNTATNQEYLTSIIFKEQSWSIIPGGSDNNIEESSSESSSKIVLAALKPHLIVTNYTYGSGPVLAGQNFNLDFTIKNTSSAKTIHNVILIVSNSEDLSIMSGTNTIYIEKIQPGEEISRKIEFKLKLNKTIDVQTVSMESSFEYYDKPDTDPVSGTDKISIPIPTIGITKARIGGINIPKAFKAEKEGNIEFSVINNGFSKVYNIEAFIYDGDGKELGWQFLGTVEGGVQPEAKKVAVTFPEGGTKNLRLVVNFEDENLETKTIERPFQIEVESINKEPDIPYIVDPGMGIGEGDFEEIESEEPFLNNKILIIAGSIVVVSAITIIIIKIKRHKEDNFDDFFDSFNNTPQNNIEPSPAPPQISLENNTNNAQESIENKTVSTGRKLTQPREKE